MIQARQINSTAMLAQKTVESEKVYCGRRPQSRDFFLHPLHILFLILSLSFCPLPIDIPSPPRSHWCLAVLFAPQSLRPTHCVNPPPRQTAHDDCSKLIDLPLSCSFLLYFLF